MGQKQFIESILNPVNGVPEGLKVWNGSDPAVRFNVYRNNVIVSLIKAVESTFPVCQQLVGEAFFHAMAREFIQQSPPTSRILAYYGKKFPDFVSHFPPASSVPYLADVAHLEILRLEAYHAEDNQPITAEQLQQVIANGELEESVFLLDKSVFLLQSAYPVFSIWGVHQTETTPSLATIDLQQAECGIIFRENLDVGVLTLPQWLFAFLQQIQQGKTLGEIVASYSDSTVFDLTKAFQFLLENKLIIGITYNDKAN